MFLLGDNEGSEDEGNRGIPPWYATYSDMMTLLLTFFVLLYSLSSSNAHKFDQFLRSVHSVLGKPGSMGRDLNRDRNGLGVLKVPKGSSIKPQKFGLTKQEISEMQTIKQELEKHLARLSNGSKVDLTMTERGLVIRLAGQLLFESGKADIRPESLGILANVAIAVKAKPNSIRIEGFTDNRPISNSRYPSNWELSTARSTSVLRYLINVHRIDPKRLSAAGYGEFRAIYPNDSDSNRSLNRRVDIVLLYPSLELKEPQR